MVRFRVFFFNDSNSNFLFGCSGIPGVHFMAAMGICQRARSKMRFFLYNFHFPLNHPKRRPQNTESAESPPVPAPHPGQEAAYAEVSCTNVRTFFAPARTPTCAPVQPILLHAWFTKSFCWGPRKMAVVLWMFRENHKARVARKQDTLKWT